MTYGISDLLEAEGYDDILDLMEDYILDSLAPAICVSCRFTTEMEQDQDHGACEGCGSNDVKSAFVLMEVI